MKVRKRVYDSLLEEHFASHRQMALVTGPRQVGKTTTCRNLSEDYVNWDNAEDRELILSGPGHLAERFGLDRLRETPPTVLFDELHKYPQWKSFLKGFFDTYADRAQIVVTGSSRLDTYRRGGESLMGRYFPYRMHPFSVAEVLSQDLPDVERIIRPPQPIKTSDFEALWVHGGYPEPFLKREARFSRRWHSLRQEQLLQEDVRDFTQIQQIGQLETLVRILSSRSASQLVYSSLASQVRVAVDTIRRWVAALSALHLGFTIQPWFNNVTRSLRKEPKWFLRDWASIEAPGARAETFVACHLLKAVEGWTDMGLGKCHLGYLRDKNQREVDFVVIRDGQPWFLAEVKYREEPVTKSLSHFQGETAAPFAFQVVLDADYVDADCFASPGRPITVPAKTLLSQLL